LLQAGGNEIGGMDDNGEPIAVEIDETKYFHRKYHGGQWREEHWVFGETEHTMGKCFLVEVADRSARTPQDKITEYILGRVWEHFTHWAKG